MASTHSYTAQGSPKQQLHPSKPKDQGFGCDLTGCLCNEHGFKREEDG